jgi:hypothetical protein
VQVVPVDTARDAWVAIDNIFASQSRTRAISTRLALATVRKGNSSVADYFGKMKTLADEMASAGKRLEFLVVPAGLIFDPTTQETSLPIYSMCVSWVQY